MAYSEVRRPQEYRKVIEDKNALAAIDKLDELLEAAGRLSDTTAFGDPVGFIREISFVFDDGYDLDYELISPYMLKDGCELRMGGETFARMGDIAWNVSFDGLTYTPAFRINEVEETPDGGLRPKRWYNEWGILEDALEGEPEDELLTPIHSLWRIYYSDRDGNILASPCLANCPAAAWRCVYAEDRARMLDEIDSPWTSLEPLTLREDHRPRWMR